MTAYEAEIIDSRAARILVNPHEGWGTSTYGGDWVTTSDPYSNNDDPVVYAGIGYGYDPAVPERFVGDEWSLSKATTPDIETGLYRYVTQGELTWHDERAWRNLMPTGTPNVWEPGVTNWREYPLGENFPMWIQPLGSVDAYPLGFEVEHLNGAEYRSLIPANTTVPGSDPRWWEHLNPVVVEGPAAWVPWPGFGPLYQAGDQVAHNGQTWTATVGNNHWTPGVFGWTAA